ALAFGQSHEGALVLLDELAHSNAPGSRHLKRWQDVEELLGAGIDVWTTMNVQHLDSLNDIVTGITGIRVWETVPDRVFDEADEVVVVDLPPDELLERLKAGKVYLAEQAERASAHFFRKGNLLALRELALRRTANRVDEEILAYRRKTSVQSVWPNREALLACVGSGPSNDKVVRTCARLAAQMDVQWHAVYVQTPGDDHESEALKQRVQKVLKIAEQLGATVVTLSSADVAQSLTRYAREHNLSRLVMGRQERRWPWQKALAERIAFLADDLDVLQVSLPRAASTGNAPPQHAMPPSNWDWRGYAVAVAACIGTALVSTPLLSVLELSNIVMIFLLAVIAVALRYGRGPAVVAAFLGVGLFDFFFVNPRFSFAVSDVQYLVTFAVMLVVALVIGQLTAGLKVQAEAALQRERRVRSLYDISRDLSSTLLTEQVAQIGQRFLTAEFGVKSTLLVADDAGHLHNVHEGQAPTDMAVAQWAFDKGEPAGRGTDTLPASDCMVLPLKAPMRTRGVLIVELPSDRTWGTEQRRLLETCATLLAISLERIHYIEVAQASTVQIESERLRNSLLSAISHDLRTPLASLVGLAETLERNRPDSVQAQQELAKSIRHSALRMTALVNNLLDMARLEAGAVQLNHQWQPLEEVIGGAIAATQATLVDRPISVRLDDGLPMLNMDAVLMERVFVNLIENAVKYTPPGTAIEISAHADGSHATITVDDYGPGLPPGKEETIFQKFERGAKESSTPGVGLGLAICRAIVQAHGGRIHAEDKEGGGARFIISLPLGQAPQDDGSDLAMQTVEELPT
ncbi:MAG TPA: DUF4118 domain-containing protein, partial [Aquabacterium sp.]|nr:DUF4118 domain-containing protein [Aquabacterium sp.]